jgi:hypothetical protein
MWLKIKKILSLGWRAGWAQTAPVFKIMEMVPKL